MCRPNWLKIAMVEQGMGWPAQFEAVQDASDSASEWAPGEEVQESGIRMTSIESPWLQCYCARFNI
jgi:hypothetical protein